MNLEQGQQAVRDRGFDYLEPDRLTFILNNAKDAFEDVWPWPWLLVAASGPTPLILPDLKLVLNVSLPNGGGELLGLSVQQVLQDGSRPDQAGSAEYWWIEGDQTLHAWPGDGAEVSIVYAIDSPPLVDPDDEPLIPARYHPLWIDYAVVEAYKDSDNFPGAQALRADIAFRMQDVIGRYETRNRQHSPFISQHAGWALHGDE